MSVCGLACVHDLLYAYDGDCVHGGAHACGRVGVLQCVYAHETVHGDVYARVYDHWYVGENVCGGGVYDDVLLVCMVSAEFGF